MTFPTLFPLRIVLLAGCGFFFLSLSILFYCLVTQRKQRSEEQLKQEITEKFRSKFNDWMAGDSPPLSRPDRDRDWIYLLNLWSQLFADADSKQQEQLIAVAEEMNFSDVTQEFIEGKDTEYWLSAFQVIAELKDEDALPAVEDHLHSTVPIVHLNALRAIVLIDQQRGLEHIIRDTRENPDAPITYYTDFCKGIDQDFLSERLIQVIEEGTPEEEARLIPLLRDADNQTILPAVRRRLKEAEHPEVISGYLRILRDIGHEEDDELVEPYLRHQASFVRTQAANTLKKIGTKDVMKTLLKAMADESWWVRLRAAEAVVHNTSINENQLDSIFKELNDPYARDALSEAMTQ